MNKNILHKLYISLFTVCAISGFSACDEDDCNLLHFDNLAHYPNVLKGTFPTEEQVIEIGETLKITPQLLEPEGASYSWLVNGEEFSTEPTFSYKVEKPCRANLTCVITNQYGSVEMNTSFRSNHNFSKGFFYIADATFNFYDTEKGVTYKDCYGSLNKGKYFTQETDYDKLSLMKANGKYYVALNTSTTNINQLFVLDAQTLYLEKEMSVNSGISNILALNDEYALLNSDGILRLNLKDLSYTRLCKTDFYIFNSMVYNDMLLTNETYGEPTNVKAYVINEILDAAENEWAVPQELSIEQKQKFNFVRSKNGDIYTLASTQEGCAVIKINEDLTVETMETDIVPAQNTGWTDATVGMAASQEENVLYIPSANGSVYKYEIGNISSISEPFIPADESGWGIVTTLRIDKEGNLYVTYGERYEGYKIVVYNREGQNIRTIDCGKSKVSEILFTE